MPSKIVSLVSLILIAAGYFWEITLLIILGAGMLLLLAVFLLYYLLRFYAATNKFIKNLEKHNITSENLFRFGFNEEAFVRETENTKIEIKWKMVRNYEVNNGDIYLYLHEGELYDIISTSIIGQENFEKFRNLLMEKTKS